MECGLLGIHGRSVVRVVTAEVRQEVDHVLTHLLNMADESVTEITMSKRPVMNRDVQVSSARV